MFLIASLGGQKKHAWASLLKYHKESPDRSKPGYPHEAVPSSRCLPEEAKANAFDCDSTIKVKGVPS